MSTNMKRKLDQALPESESRSENDPKAKRKAKRPIRPKPCETMDDQVKADVEKAFQVKVLHYLGGGQYGAVFACESLQDGQKYAVKLLKSTCIWPEGKRLAWEKDAKEEIDALKDLVYENILKYYEHAFVKHHVYKVNLYLAIKTELLDCTLRQILEERELTVSQVEHLLRSLGGAISFMAEGGYAHHDIKPDNIMFKNLDRNAEDFDAAFMKAIPKLTDFGFALLYVDEDEDDEDDEDGEDKIPLIYKAKENFYRRGSPFYCSPDKFAFLSTGKGGYSPFQADSYSFAVSMLQCLMPPKPKDSKTKKEDEDDEIRKMFFTRRTWIDALNLYRQRHPQEDQSPCLKAIEKLIEDLEFVSDVIDSLV